MNYYPTMHPELTTKTTQQLQQWYDTLTTEDKQQLTEEVEGYLLTSPQGSSDYKMELLMSNLYGLLNPEEGEPLKQWTQQDEDTYHKYWWEKTNKKLTQYYKYWGGPWKQGETYYTQNPWGKTTWQLDEEGNPTNVKTQYKYLPGPLPKSNWNQYEWLYGKTGTQTWEPKE